MKSRCNGSTIGEVGLCMEQNQEFGIDYGESLQQLTGLQTLEKSERFKKELKLVLQFAELLPERITLNGFRDLISKMTPDILVHQFFYDETFLHKLAQNQSMVASHPLLTVEYYHGLGNEYGDTFLHKMVKKNNMIALRALLTIGHDNYREIVDESGYTALHEAAERGLCEMISLLLEDSRPEFREIVNKYGATALHTVSRNGNVDSVKALLKDSRPEFREVLDEYGSTALHMACIRGDVECIKALLKDSRPEYREMVTKTGCTTLHEAVLMGHYDVVALLLEDSRPEFREIVNEAGKRAIELTDNVTIMRLLLKAKYEAMVLSTMLTTLSVLDGNDLFWSDDSTAKDTLLWILDHW
eukprot:TRINITY_DN2142_c0_g2_i5.p1 TRINITY_DN2142_c0_g2~~TRINITY_DN2142_c0_g2_i5.p1  ORF type:complete len:357 (-),score=72.27 TRINITY_DN2142_c0_g2_i5:1414-2484(-)